MAPPPTKKLKSADDGNSASSSSSLIADVLMESRKSKAESIEKFKFNETRAKLLTGNEGYLHREAKGIAYYMHRDQR